MHCIIGRNCIRKLVIIQQTYSTYYRHLATDIMSLFVEPGNEIYGQCFRSICLYVRVYVEKNKIVIICHVHGNGLII